MTDPSDIPECVYRAFSNVKYADLFLENGKLRIGRIDAYRTIESRSRVDRTEGVAKTTFYEGEGADRRVMSAEASSANPVYILCTSLPNVEIEHLRQQFGNYVVQISDVAKFAEDIGLAIERAGYRLNKPVQYAAVEYSKGEFANSDLGPFAGATLGIIQKDRKFLPDSEFRFYATLPSSYLSNGVPPYLDLEFERAPQYARFINNAA